MTVAQSLSYGYRNDADKLNQESRIGANSNVLPHAASQYRGFADRSPIVEQTTFTEFKAVEEGVKV
jgi:hypothetical protein